MFHQSRVYTTQEKSDVIKKIFKKNFGSIIKTAIALEISYQSLLINTQKGKLIPRVRVKLFKKSIDYLEWLEMEMSSNIMQKSSFKIYKSR